MNEVMQQVIDDIRDTMWHEAKRVIQISPTGANRLVRHMCLPMAAAGISTRFSQPLRPDLLTRLGQEVNQYPEMLGADDYPNNITRWIEAHLFDWEQGDFLGVYLPSSLLKNCSRR